MSVAVRQVRHYEKEEEGGRGSIRRGSRRGLQRGQAHTVTDVDNQILTPPPLPRHFSLWVFQTAIAISRAVI